MAGFALTNILISIGAIAAAVVVLFFLAKRFSRVFVKIVVTLLINSVLGLIALLLLVYFVGFSIPIDTPVLIATGVFGLPGVGTIALLKFYGASLLVAV